MCLSIQSALDINFILFMCWVKFILAGWRNCILHVNFLINPYFFSSVLYCKDGYKIQTFSMSLKNVNNYYSPDLNDICILLISIDSIVSIYFTEICS